MLTSEEGCGGKVASDTGEYTLRLVERIRRLGEHLDYLAMNEPLLHAVRQKQRLCANSVEAMTAANVARTLREVRKTFPDVEVGDIEAIGTWKGTEEFGGTIARWAEAFQAETGRKLAFMHADVGWILPWIDVVGRLGDEMHARDIPFGVIYNGMDLDLSDAAWIDDAEQHFLAYENSGYRLPDMAIFQSWAEYPRRILPEDDKIRSPSLVLRYLHPRSIVHAERHGTSIVGQVVDEQNAPIANAPVSLYSRPLQGVRPGGMGGTTGVVPTDAIRASFVVSMNYECACEAQSSIVLKNFEYTERVKETVADATHFDGKFSEWKSLGSGRTKNNAGSGVEILTDLDSKRVSSRHSFRPCGDPPSMRGRCFRPRLAQHAGGFGILKFLDGAGKEVRRTYIFLKPGWAKIAEAKSQKDGSFVISVDPKFDFRKSAFKITYSGDEAHRPSHFELRALRKNK